MNLSKLGTQVKALAEQFEAESWLPAEKIHAMQFEKLERLAKYCELESPFFASRLRESHLTPETLATPEGLKQFSLLTRRDLQSSLENLYCKPPKGHLPCSQSTSSGSTGEPVTVRRTAANYVYMAALVTLENIWHQRDPQGRLCVIRATLDQPTRHPTWAVPIALVCETGPSMGLPSAKDISELVKELGDFEADHLWIYPNTLAAVLQYCEDNRITFPSLKNIRSMTGNLSDAVKQRAKEYFQCKVADTYSSAEFGVIAFECPQSGLLHIAAPSVIVEILNAAGEQCEVGEIGRITITDLINLATPLVRYDIGDYAQVGPICPCGRGWPTLSKIMGRERNLMRMPDGSRHWPSVGAIVYRDAAPVKQFQYIQHSPHNIELRLVTDRPISQEEESALVKLINTRLGAPFLIDFQYYDSSLPLGPQGKFEEFICKIP